MLGSSTTNVEIYSATLGAVNGSFDMNIKLTKVHKPQLLTLDNPNYATLLSKYNHLKGVKIEDKDTRPKIPYMWSQEQACMPQLKQALCKE